MNSKRKIVLVLLLSILTTMLFTSTLYADNQPSISLELDKTTASVGEIIKASLKINNIKNFGGYQVRLRYNPEVLQAVDANTGSPLEEKTPPTKGDVLRNPAYSPLDLTTNIVKQGILDFGELYMNMTAYRNSGKPESTGTLAVIGFKVLKDAATEVIFDDLNGNPGAIDGVMLFDWDGNQITSGYNVVPASKINVTSSPIPLPSFTARPSSSPQSNGTSASPDSSAAPEASASTSPDNSSASPDNSNTSDNDTGSDNKLTTDKSTLTVIIIVLAAVVIIIPIIMIVLIKKKRK